MALKKKNNTGTLWEANRELHKLISTADYQTTFKSEREYETYLAGHLQSQKTCFGGHKFISQISDEEKVTSAYCFGKKHRPDMSIDTDGIAIELKYFKGSPDEIKKALGQSILYRIQYGWTFLICVVGRELADVYTDIATGKESNLEHICKTLAEDFKVYTYFVSQKKPQSGHKKCINFFPEQD